jgi:hypothetical protein
LRPFSRFSQTDLFPLDRSGVTRDISRLSKRRSQVVVVLKQRPRNPVPNCTRLAKPAATFHGHSDVKLAGQIDQLKRLPYNHTRCFTAKILIERAVIDNNCAFP